MAIDPITKVLAIENQTVATVPSPSVNQIMAQVPSFTMTQTVAPTGHAKELWESLDRKYKTEDAGAKKFIVGLFVDYKMVDSKPVISQVQELQVILLEIHGRENEFE
ncbi:Uncharacterized protein Adt_02979 [Abeliophyllum distichum]|uniref:Uncharacterized protein n=1 Tax=Abeliophyllum distichum TaxID=126358 RepID=A0ABD1VXM5_9LAMI